MLGSGIGIGPIERILLGTMSATDLVAPVWEQLCASGQTLSKDSKPFQSAGDARLVIEDRIRYFRDELQLWLHQLGVSG